jgi:hypothetical protein
VKRGLLKNPPLPASALLELATGQSLVREAGEDWIDDPMDKHIGIKIGKALPLMHSGYEKIVSSHKHGDIDYQNPPLSSQFRAELLSIQRDIEALAELYPLHGQINISQKDMHFSLTGIADKIQEVRIMLGKMHGFTDNPPLTEIYHDIIEIRAKKKDGKLYRHPFGVGSGIFGLPDGSILVKSRKGKRLWKNFPKGRN